ERTLTRFDRMSSLIEMLIEVEVHERVVVDIYRCHEIQRCIQLQIDQEIITEIHRVTAGHYVLVAVFRWYSTRQEASTTGRRHQRRVGIARQEHHIAK